MLVAFRWGFGEAQVLLAMTDGTLNSAVDPAHPPPVINAIHKDTIPSRPTALSSL